MILLGRTADRARPLNMVSVRSASTQSNVVTTVLVTLVAVVQVKRLELVLALVLTTFVQPLQPLSQICSTSTTLFPDKQSIVRLNNSTLSFLRLTFGQWEVASLDCNPNKYPASGRLRMC